MKFLELFSGTRRMADTFEKHGYDVYTVEIDTSFPRIDRYEDVLTITAQDILDNFGQPDVIWASPPCTTYSISAIFRHRERSSSGNLLPKSAQARVSDQLIQHTLDLIRELNPTYYFIENPRAALRKMDFMEGLPRYTVTYCQYGETRQKPTDIWTNHPSPNFKPICAQGSPCHEAAPRGSQTGTQGLKNAKERAMLPIQLCEHIVSICDELRCTDELESMGKGSVLPHQFTDNYYNISIYDIIRESEHEERS